MDINITRLFVMSRSHTKAMTMKQIATLLVMLFATFPGYGDQWDDLYQRKLDHIQDGLDISPIEGHATANNYASSCFYYVVGFVHGSLVNGSVRERDSKRFTDWVKSQDELSSKRGHFVRAGDPGHAAYYAKQEFELNCQYQATLQRESSK